MEKFNLPVVHQYSVFDEVEDVVKVSQVSDVDNLSPEGKRISRYCQKSCFCISKVVLSVSLSEPRLQ